MPATPARIALQIDGISVPSEHSPPMPVMTMRGEAMSGLIFDQLADRRDNVADILEVVPGFNRIHLDLDTIGFLKIENDFSKLKRMDAELGQFSVQCDFAAIRVGMRLDLFDDFPSE